MGNSSSHDDAPDFALPSQQVVSIHDGQMPVTMPAPGQRGRVPDVMARQAAAATATRHATQEVKVPLVWHKGSLMLQRGAGRSRWELTAAFTADEPCHLDVSFHCHCNKESGIASYVAADHDSPPGFRKAYPAGKHDVNFVTIDLHRWPLEVFWRYKSKTPNVIPIALLLTCGRATQAVMHLSLDVPGGRLGYGSLAGLECKLLSQKVFLNGREWQLEEMFGLAEMGSDLNHDESSHGSPCVICLTDPRNTAVLPCKHLCVCEDCGGQLQAVQAQRQCPICRQKITGLQIIEVTGKV